MEKVWRLKQPIDQKIQTQFPQIEPILLQLLWNRGLITQQQIDEFLNPDWSEDVHDPYLFKDMQRACDLVYKAIEQGKKIAVYGDYDADGVCGSVILVETLKLLMAELEIYIPHREREGYGLNQAAIRYLADKKVSLIITCDCGVANVEEINLVNSLGLQIIITDHHQTKEELPKAAAIIHTGLRGEKYPCKNLSGGATAFKLVQGLLRHPTCHLSNREKEIHEKWLLDLVAISLVADMVPLLGEARTLVKYGLVVLGKTRRLGLKKLLTITNIEPSTINTNTLAWQIVPRINAAGRMDHANASYELLITNDEVRAEELARALNITNLERQKITDAMVDEAIKQISVKPKDKIITAFKPEWQLGLVGLVAGKLVQIYNRPALVMCSDGKSIVGSGRSIPDFNLIDLFQDTASLLEKYGGHKQAAGFRLTSNNYEDFITKCHKVARSKITDEALIPILEIDAELALGQVSWPLYEQVVKLEPYGQNNPIPLFIIKNLTVVSLDKVGNTQRHWRLMLKDEETEKKFIAFGAEAWQKNLDISDKIDVVCEVGINQWNGNRELQLKIIDFKLYDKKNNLTS